MDPNTCDEILNAHDATQSWKTQLMIPHGNEMIDVSYPVTFDQNEIPPPAIGELPVDCYYQFDPNKFRGSESENDVVNCLKKACSGCTMEVKHRWVNHFSMLNISLRCSCNRTTNLSKQKDNFDDGKFGKKGTKPTTVVQQNKFSDRAYARMGNKGLKRNKWKPVADNRGC